MRALLLLLLLLLRLIHHFEFRLLREKEAASAAAKKDGDKKGKKKKKEKKKKMRKKKKKNNKKMKKKKKKKKKTQSQRLPNMLSKKQIERASVIDLMESCVTVGWPFSTTRIEMHRFTICGAWNRPRTREHGLKGTILSVPRRFHAGFMPVSCRYPPSAPSARFSPWPRSVAPPAAPAHLFSL